MVGGCCRREVFPALLKSSREATYRETTVLAGYAVSLLLPGFHPTRALLIPTATYASRCRPTIVPSKNADDIIIKTCGHHDDTITHDARDTNGTTMTRLLPNVTPSQCRRLPRRRTPGHADDDNNHDDLSRFRDDDLLNRDDCLDDDDDPHFNDDDPHFKDNDSRIIDHDDSRLNDDLYARMKHTTRISMPSTTTSSPSTTTSTTTITSLTTYHTHDEDDDDATPPPHDCVHAYHTDDDDNYAHARDGTPTMPTSNNDVHAIIIGYDFKPLTPFYPQ
ncbi:hypothetical protein BDZ89DRAFT_1054965 [Hymenopellis radicata]|nr:hypothetical protein BDZ89DRAFT_1054965 [Hymenopellis radicata]